MARPSNLKIRPYARLLTMLGDQLIKNERIALVELVKNSYDADASWVKISFEGLGKNYEVEKDSKIIIEDNGNGMSLDIIKNHWLNPATPEKRLRKRQKETSPCGRILQGEKGIGRFGVLKLGKKISIISKMEDDPLEHVLVYDFTNYDDEFLSECGKDKAIYIDDLNITLRNRKPRVIVAKEIMLHTQKIARENHGTRIIIENLKGSWSKSKVDSAYSDVAKLRSLFAFKKKHEKEFNVFIYKDDVPEKLCEPYDERLKTLLEERTVLKIQNGKFNSKSMEYEFEINKVKKSVSISDPTIRGLSLFKKNFGTDRNTLENREIECGNFSFEFYIFDFNSKGAPLKYHLDHSEKKIIKDHRIYLYRDGIRVYPYGEPNDDWLSIDIHRGTISAGHFLSNDQVVGFVDITQEDNPNLKDKTNREGLIEEGNATSDLIGLLQVFLSYVRQKYYARYLADNKFKKQHDVRKEGIEHLYDDLKEVIGDNPKAVKKLFEIKKLYKAEKKFLETRAETTENLAGVGLSVETASHDMMAIMQKTFTNLDGLIRDLMSANNVDKDMVLKELQSIRGGMGFIHSQMKDIQILFTSSKQRRKSIRVKEIVEKVEHIYRRILKNEEIELTVNSQGSPLIAKTTDAVLLQLLINLFDNAVFWLCQSSNKNKKIEILLDGRKGRMIFSDNGPGVNPDDVPYIFEPFYSGKGEDGRGLGLYIARQLLERHDYSIDLRCNSSERLQSGANFFVNFFQEDI